MRSFINEAYETIDSIEIVEHKRNVSVFSGKLAYPVILDICERIMNKFSNITVHCYEIVNRFFGETITVTGLLTGRDIVEQLREEELGEELLIPSNTLKSDEDIFLDDMTLDELKSNLQINVNIVKSSGDEFVNSLIFGQESVDKKVNHSPYEL